MFEELVPPEIREALSSSFEARSLLHRMITWSATMAHLPSRFDQYMGEQLARMERAAWEIVGQYRRGELSLAEAIARLDFESDLERLDPPDIDLIQPRSDRRFDKL